MATTVKFTSALYLRSSPAEHARDDVLLSKDGRSEVESSWSLTEARTRNDANSRGFKQGKSIEGISSHASLVGGRYCLLWQVNLGEGVHGALHSVAGDPLDGVEGVCHQLGSLGQRGQHPINLIILVSSVWSTTCCLRQQHWPDLCLPAGIAWVTFPWWVHNNIHASLSYHSWAKLDGGDNISWWPMHYMSNHLGWDALLQHSHHIRIHI